jgi:hypothetical protein
MARAGKETPDCGNWMKGKKNVHDATNDCRCTGGTMYNVEIMDQVRAPA